MILRDKLNLHRAIPMSVSSQRISVPLSIPNSQRNCDTVSDGGDVRGGSLDSFGCGLTVLGFRGKYCSLIHAHPRLFHGDRVGLRGAYDLASIYTLHVMTHAKTQAEVTNDQRADDGQSNDEDADDTPSFAIADGDRQQLQRHERERHRIAGGKQDDATRSAGGADEVHDSQKHQT